MFRRAIAPAAHQRQLITLSFLNFAVLGCHVGVYAVQLAPLAATLQLDPARLGFAVTCAALAGLVTLFGGGVLADRLGRRAVLLTGFLGTGMSFVLLSLTHSYPALLGVFVLYGLTVSFIDLGVNTVGSDLEAMTGRKIMTGLHAGFSAGACIGALASALLLTAGLDSAASTSVSRCSCSSPQCSPARHHCRSAHPMTTNKRPAASQAASGESPQSCSP